MWIKGNYRRIFLDMHIDDSRKEYFSKLDPNSLVQLLKGAGAQQIVVKCRPHTGLAHYPTKIGRMHKGLKGKDYVKEMTDLCHENGIAVMAYFSQIFDNYAYDHHPSWRVINGEGRTSREYLEPGSSSMFRKGRYGIVCPNNEEYREYVRACLNEITSNYEFESIFLDMPFLPEVCFCPSCKEKYYRQSGHELPTIIDWSDPVFREYQLIREKWMGEFAAFSTKCVKEIRHEVTIEHNMAVASAPWQFATSDFVADACDYVGGDLYGGYLEQTFISKYYRNLSKALPFVYITSRCDPNLQYHTTTKTKEEFLLHIMTSLAHNGALSICDGINPDGTLCEEVYNGPVKEAFAVSQKYEKYVSGALQTNVSIWFPSHSKYDWSENGKPVSEHAKFDNFVNGFIRDKVLLASILRTENIPFDVVPSKTLSSLSNNLLAISNVVSIQDDEMAEIERFVKNGGNLYVSGHLGHSRLCELLEIEPDGMTQHDVTYMNPTAAGMSYFEGFSLKSPLAVQSKQQIVKIKGECEILATITLPYTMTSTNEFSAIHSNPPGINTEMPAAFLKQVGKGRVLWVAAPIETSRPYTSRKTVTNMVKSLCGEVKFESNAPAFVEILNWTKDGKQYFAALNQQEVMPIVPISDINITVSGKINGARLVESGEKLLVEYRDGKSVISLPKLEIFHILVLD